jgi:hypothetical protein
VAKWANAGNPNSIHGLDEARCKISKIAVGRCRLINPGATQNSWYTWTVWIDQQVPCKMVDAVWTVWMDQVQCKW